MIDYEFGEWGVELICRKHGSVLPRALVWAMTSAITTAAWCQGFRMIWGAPENYPDIGGTAFTIVWGGYAFTFGFLLVFRTQIAFSRFSEGATALWAVKGVWVNVVSNLLAFTTTDRRKKHEAEAFQQFLVPLMSLLFSVSLGSISTAGTEFSALDQDCIDNEHLDYLENVHDRVEVVLNWVQRLIVENHQKGILSVPPPILSRVFQELGNGVQDLQGARKIQTCPFPFPYAQAISLFLVADWLLLPIIAAFFIPQPLGAAGMSFCTLFAQSSISYIAAELEMPFGDDPNDLPLHDLQGDFNACMRMLMHPMTRKQPVFVYRVDECKPSHQGSACSPARFGSGSQLSSLFLAPSKRSRRKLEKEEKRRRQDEESSLPSEDPTMRAELSPREPPPGGRSQGHAPDTCVDEDLVPPPTAALMCTWSAEVANSSLNECKQGEQPGHSSCNAEHQLKSPQSDENAVQPTLGAAPSAGCHSTAPATTCLTMESTVCTLCFRSRWANDGQSTYLQNINLCSL
eukprot:TRINITY_DN8507_c0_g1_i1.p1 TRINITY_DN8507_c0_g1~~TRINITY_DN8507_c0_g1_i1.p1  ORF type:complete len:516 (-),score=45.49 TRINITY_DN8507_c0_g1_i1:509-2056(-)